MSHRPMIVPAAGLLLGAGLLVVALRATAQGPGQGPPGPGQKQGPGRGFGPGGMPPFPLLQALDADGDGALSAREIDNAAAALRTLDKDKNGKLTREEMLPPFMFGRPPGPQGPNPEELVAQLMEFDKDKDGKLTRDELPARMQNLMDRADANKDGVLDKAELTRFAEQRTRREER